MLNYSNNFIKQFINKANNNKIVRLLCSRNNCTYLRS